MKNLIINFYLICFAMKINIMYCFPAQISYLGKILFLKYGPKYSQQIRSQEWTDGIKWFFTCWYKFRKAKSSFNGFLLWDPKICCISRMNFWIERIFCMLIVMQQFLGRLIILHCICSFSCFISALVTCYMF